MKLVKDFGLACAKHHDGAVRGLKPQSVQCDELWAFIYAKAKNVAKAKAAPRGAGDVWTWTALDPHTKLMITYQVGGRTENDAAAFMLDLADRIVNITQLTTDGLGV